MNSVIGEFLVSGVSQRRLAILLRINRKTVTRKFLFLGQKALLVLRASQQGLPKVTHMQFDDIEIIEHTKCKLLSITLAVTDGERRILGFRVSEMLAKGNLAKIARKKYGKRHGGRAQARRSLFAELQPLIADKATIFSDKNTHYPKDVKTYFPSLNHTAAMLQANSNRLFRRTWCTTKKPERLALHIALYAVFHNTVLIT